MSGKVALVTGGAAGTGAAFARAMVGAGAEVVVADVLDRDGETLARELGDACLYQHLDVTSEMEWRNCLQATLDRFGKLNVLVNNAAIVTSSSVGAYTRSDWDTILAVNLTGSFLGIQACREALIAGAPSSIINISLTAGPLGSACLYGYIASNSAVRGLIKLVAMEVGKYGVRVNFINRGHFLRANEC